MKVSHIASIVSFVAMWLLVLHQYAHAAEPQCTTPARTSESNTRVFAEGQRPNDRRLGPLTSLNGEHPFCPSLTVEAWEKRAERIRRQILVAAGLWPMVSRTPLNPVVHGLIDRGDYTVEVVYFQSFPDHVVTGNLYRPKGAEGRRPAVLSAHGHGGRFEDLGPVKIRQLVADGEERFEVGGRYRTQSRCVQLARMGCVVFQYDMIGYGDSRQLPHGAKFREALNGLDNWGLGSVQAETHLQNPLGLQTYNSLCALDFLSSLPDVDPNRIAMVGSSGGGSQTLLLCAIDQRPAVAFPAVMVSTEMQGGCSCENACYLRIGTGNVEFAALMAPRPLGMAGANDWTRNFESKGLPELKQLYKLLGVEDRVMGKVYPLFPHGWSYPARALMYRWLNQQLKMGLAEPIVEEDYLPLSKDEMTVWKGDHSPPAGGDDAERSLLNWITADAQQQLSALIPNNEATLAEYRRVIGGAMDILIGRTVPDLSAVTTKVIARQSFAEYELRKLLVRNTAADEELPAIALIPKKPSRHVVLWISPEGKQGLFDNHGKPLDPITELLSAGRTVVGVDLIGQGELAFENGKAINDQLPEVEKYPDWNTYAGFTYGYNYPLLAQRAQDILTIVGSIRGEPLMAERIDLVGLECTGPWVACARAQAGSRIAKTAIDTRGFRFARLKTFDDPCFLPGGAKYLDLPGILALIAPHPLWLAGETQDPAIIAAAYRAENQSKSLKIDQSDSAHRAKAAVNWLLE